MATCAIGDEGRCHCRPGCLSPIFPGDEITPLIDGAWALREHVVTDRHEQLLLDDTAAPRT